MSRWKIKGCPKCGGDLFEETISGDREICCLQCGYVIPAQPVAAVSMQAQTAGRQKPPGVALRRAA